MNGSYLLSIVVPTCDRTLSVMNLVSRLNKQIGSCGDIQLIVVDNGIAQKNVFDENSPGYATYVSAAPMIGPAAARNLGAKYSAGTWITFIDDDDDISDGYIEELYQILQNEKRKIVFTLPIFKKNNEVVQRYKSFPEDKARQINLLFHNPGFGGQNVIYHHSVFKNLGGFDISLKSSEDRDLGVRALLNGYKIIPLDQPYIVLVQHDGVRARHFGRIRGTLQFYVKHRRSMNSAQKMKIFVRTFIYFLRMAKQKCCLFKR